jgi:hypothetical protein
MTSLTRTARVTGMLYLGLAITGMLGFLLIRPVLFSADDPGATAAALAENETLARIGIALEIAIVLTQALAAIWFYKLFATVRPVAAATIAAFGLVNAVAILGSTAAISTALAVALDPALAPSGDVAAAAAQFYTLSDAFWSAGNLFFGLWLIPMGAAVLTSGWAPRLLGWALIAGGFGYCLSAFTTALLPEADAVNTALTLPATVAEFWMIGYLLIVGVRRSAQVPTPAAALA